jgi:LysM repeat protein
MTHLFAILLTAALLLPLTPVTAEAKATSTAAQIHVVKPGDTLSEIARRHGLAVDELKRLNGLNSSRLKIGQKLALTRAAAPPAPRGGKIASANPPAAKDRKSAASAGSYRVRNGDSLYSIARRHNLTVDQLKQANGLTGNHLKVGQRLALSGSTPTEPVIAKPAQRSASDTHVVRKGETLSSIARRHGMAVEDLKRINDLTGSRLRIGQRLALASPEPDPSPLLLPGDASEDEVIGLATVASSELEQVAFNYLSTPYRFGGNSSKGIDCSAFVQKVFREVDVNLPRSAREQFREGEEVGRDDLQPGDLLFFRTYAKYPSHVGIYLGDGKMIHASSRSRRVVVTDIDFPYYRKRFIGAKRITLLEGVIDDLPAQPDNAAEELAAPVDNLLPAQPADSAPLKLADPSPQPEVTTATLD